MNQLVHKPTGLVSRDPFIFIEIAEWDRVIKREGDWLLKTKKSINECLEMHERDNSFTMDEIIKLEEQAKELRNEIMGKQSDDMPHPEIDMGGIKIPDESKPDAPERVKNDCKKMYRAISKLCHPDITDDTEKNDLFITASQCFFNWDVTGLRMIVSHLEMGGDFVARKIDYAKLLKAKQMKASQMKAESAQIRKSLLYRINELSENDSFLDTLKASRLFRELIHARRNAVVELVAKLKRELNPESAHETDMFTFW